MDRPLSQRLAGFVGLGGDNRVSIDVIEGFMQGVSDGGIVTPI